MSARRSRRGAGRAGRDQARSDGQNQPVAAGSRGSGVGATASAPASRSMAAGGGGNGDGPRVRAGSSPEQKPAGPRRVVMEPPPERSWLARRWPRLAAGLAGFAVVLGVVADLTGVVSFGTGWTLHDALTHHRTRPTASPAPSSTPPVASTPNGPPAAISVAPGETVRLPNGWQDLHLPPGWGLHGRAANEGRCAFTIDGPDGAHYADGADVLIHGRAGGLYHLKDPRDCILSVSGTDNAFTTLPISDLPTAQGGATPIFTATGFTVTISQASTEPSRCYAAVIDATTGRQIGARANPSASAHINYAPRAGRFWVETELYGCTLTVTE
jgi:hypothetical protein